MNDQTTLTLYQLCASYNLDGLIDTFGDLPDTSEMHHTEYKAYKYYNYIHYDPRIEFDDSHNPVTNYAYYKAWYNTLLLSESISNPIREWLLKLDPNICVDSVINDYMADEHLSNDALFAACESGHYNVVKWLLEEEPYLSSFKNRCNICNAFEMSCKYGNLDITKMIFHLLPEYISERDVLNTAYKIAMINQRTQTAEWLLQINPNINTTI